VSSVRKAYLPLWLHLQLPDMTFRNGVSIRSLSEAEKPDVSSWGQFMSPDEIRRVSQFGRWMCLDFEVEHPHQGGGTPIEAKASRTLANTMLALQVVAPVGCYIFDVFIQSGDTSLNLYQVDHNQILTSAGCARMSGAGTLSLEEIEKVVDGVLALIETEQPRLNTPLGLLLNGMSGGDIYVKTLLWVAAMDSILMAEKAKAFKQRLCKILGSETEVFPGLEAQGVPPYSVDDLASDIYVLRNQIAHGGVILSRFLELPPVSSKRNVNASYPGLVTYVNVLHEASIVLLCRLLRHIILRDMLPIFTAPKQWKHFLEVK
jgi:hypothetical protein